MNTPLLQTQRLILRPLKVNDADDVYNNWASDPEVGKYMRWPLHKSVKVTKAWLQCEEKNLNSDKEYNFGFMIKENNMLIGSGGLVFKEETNCFELGYNLMKKCWGKGLAKEACTEIIRFAREELKQEEIFVCHAKENVRSESLIKRLGFKFIKDGTDSNFDGSKMFITKEYKLKL